MVPNAKGLRPGKNTRVYAQVIDPSKLMARSSVVICGGGHSTIMDAISMGKPIISVPDMFHFEQESNANQLQALGFGTRIDYNTSEPIIEELILDHSTNRAIHKRMETMAKLAKEIDGGKRMVELASELKPKKKK
ncbi:MAG: hypothetical protein J4215_01095 [Candidatus Diapherotrites archaeon]|uniref:Glycosyl transferase family 28 C-terminal domain-containing protein n=1 Tax=Candidatus Iainarchaeum sp. TaxID=3101447 RepID=A0A8T4L8R8_9ARCH|nr:hypothetical protein [Candidatus Diapherotrites archaeon]